jgi:hypothetical protein
MRRRMIVAVVGTALLAGGAMAGPAALSGSPVARVSLASSSSTPAVDPSNFVRHVTNPFFPLKPGTELVYRGIKDGGTQVDRVFVTFKTKSILGVQATEVRDVARHGSTLLEQTRDWFAQDREGNVWYFGERTAAFSRNGHVSHEGSWQAGVDGATPGIVMEANPQAPDGYRQELYRGHAMDQAWILRRGGTIDVPFGHLDHILVTMEWTPLEPSVIDKKIYARGIGIVREVAVAGDLETAELIRVHHSGG